MSIDETYDAALFTWDARGIFLIELYGEGRSAGLAVEETSVLPGALAPRPSREGGRTTATPQAPPVTPAKAAHIALDKMCVLVHNHLSSGDTIADPATAIDVNSLIIDAHRVQDLVGPPASDSERLSYAVRVLTEIKAMLSLADAATLQKLLDQVNKADATILKIDPPTEGAPI